PHRVRLHPVLHHRRTARRRRGHRPLLLRSLPRDEQGGAALLRDRAPRGHAEEHRRHPADPRRALRLPGLPRLRGQARCPLRHGQEGLSVQDPEDQAKAEAIPGSAPGRRREGAGVAIASAVGLLALLVSAYTAYIQRQQVRAEVWPYLAIAYQDLDYRLTVFNKGVGPARIQGVRMTVDGQPQQDWEHALDALGLGSVEYGHSTFSGMVLAPGEALPMIVVPDPGAYARFRAAMS